MMLGYSRQSFEKYPNIKCHGNTSIGSRAVPYGQTDTQIDGHTDRHDEADSHFSQYCESA
jgi:hypothetical protein